MVDRDACCVRTRGRRGRPTPRIVTREIVSYCITCTRRQDTRIEARYKEMGDRKVKEEKDKAKRFIYVGATGVALREAWSTKTT